MDIDRPDLTKKKKRKQFLWTAVSVFLFASIVIGSFLYDPGPYAVDKELIWTGEVKNGPMLRQIRGVGTLVPADIRWVAAQSAGRIERILILPGAKVEVESVIMELSNPELHQQTQAALLQLKSDQANFISYKVDLQSALLEIESGIAQLEADARQAILEAKINEELFNEGLESELGLKRSELRAEQFNTRLVLERKRLAFRKEGMDAQLSARQALIEQTKDRHDLLVTQLDGLTVRAGFAGVMQKLSVEEGQQVGPGQSLSQVANPKSLKAVIRVSEHQAKDVLIGQIGEIDTRNGLIQSTVIRVDPTVQDGTVAVDMELLGALPIGSRPDLTVEGVIEIENIPETTFVERPVYARSDSTTTLYRFVGESNIAQQTPVKFGRTSVSTIEVLEGLQAGDRIILSDTNEWDDFPEIRIR